MGLKLLLTILGILILASCSKSQPVQVFSKAPQAPFAGAGSITPNLDGTFTLSWQAPAITENLKYQIFEREDLPANLIDKFTEFFNASEARFATPHAISKTTSWTSEVLLFKHNTCFVVRVISKQYKDKNTHEICTNHTQYTFAGLQDMAANADSSYTLTWNAVPFIAATYDVFMRTENGGLYNYNKPVATTLTSASYASEVLTYKPSQCFMVRATAAKGEFIDANTTEICTKHAQQTLATPSATPQNQPAEVSDLIATAISATSVSIAYTASSNASSYKISYAQGVSAPADCLTSNATTTASTAITLSDLQSDTAYGFRVCAINGSGDSSLGTTIVGNTLQPAPNNVTSLVATATNDTSIGLTWATGGGSTAGYKISYASGATAPLTCALGTVLPSGQISGTTATVTGLTANTQYSFRVCAINSSVTPDISSGTTAMATTLQTAPPNVNSLLAVAISDTIIDLTWVTGAGSTAAYAVSYVSGASAPATCALGTVLPGGQINGTTASVTGLAANTQYSFRVCAVNSNATPNVSSGITVTGTTLQVAPPNANTFLAVPTSDAIIGLTWVTGGGSTAGYKVSYASGASAPATCALGTVLPGGQISGTTATVSGLTSNTQYSFRVCAINGNATPDISSGATTSITTLFSAPPNVVSLSGTASSSSVIELSWSTGGGSASGYKVSYASGATPPATCALGTLLPGGQISGTTASVTSLTANTQYGFRVCALNSNATPDVSSGTTVVATTLQIAPPDVTGLTATVNSDTNISLGWTSGGGSTTGYTISYASGAAPPATCIVGVALPAGQISGTTASITGLTGNTQYSFRVCAINGNPTPNISSGTTTSGTTIKAAPTDLSASNGVNLATLSWTTVSGASNYAIYYSTTASVTKAASRVVVAAPSYQVTALTGGATYYFNIAVIIGTTESDLSSHETSAVAYTLPPAAPTGVYLSWPYIKAVQANFSAVAGAFSYKAYYKATAGVTTSDSFVTGNSSGLIISNLASLGTYYARVSSIDIYGQEGSLSSEVSLAMPAFVKVSQNFAPSAYLGGWVQDVYVVGSTVYAATQYSGLSISTNNGVLWTTKTTAQGLGGNSLAKIYVSGNNIYTGTENGFSISTDNGATFSNKTTANGLGNDGILDFYVSDSTIYAATYNGLSISTNNGFSWVNKTTANGLGDNTIRQILLSNGNMYASTDQGVSISTNNGLSWVNKTYADGLESTTIYLVYASGNNIYVATDAGLAISTDSGNTFSNKTTANGLSDNSILQMVVLNGNIYAVNSDKLSVSTDGGNTFITKTSADGLADDFINGIYTSGGNLYVATLNGLSVSTNNGSSWTSSSVGLNCYRVYYASGNNIFMSTDYGLSTSTNNGITWGNIPNYSGPAESGANINRVYASGNNIYAGTDTGLWWSVNGGITWSEVGLNNGSNAAIYGVYGSGSYIYAATSGSGMFISTDNGSTWVQKSTGEGLPVAQTRDVNATGGFIYVATANGLSISTNSGGTWANKTSANGMGTGGGDKYMYRATIFIWQPGLVFQFLPMVALPGLIKLRQMAWAPITCTP